MRERRAFSEVLQREVLYAPFPNAPTPPSLDRVELSRQPSWTISSVAAPGTARSIT